MYVLLNGKETTAEEIKKMHEEDKLAVITSGEGVALMFLDNPFDDNKGSYWQHEHYWQQKKLGIKRPLDLSAALFAAQY